MTNFYDNINNNKKIYQAIFIFIGFAFLSFRLWRIADYGLWLDEVFSLRAVEGSWSFLFQTVINDVVHPPLFYVLLKIWGGHYLLWLKGLPFLFSLLSIIPFYLLTRELKLKKIEFLTAFIFVSFNNYLIFYAQELRMYSLLQFLSLVSIWLFAKLLREKSDSGVLFLLFFVNFLLIYTQYFGWFVVLVQFIYICLWHRNLLLKYFLQSVVLVISFVPWAYFVYLKIIEKRGLSENLSWINKPQISDVYLFFAELHGALPIRFGTTLGCIFLGLPLILWFWQIIKSKNSEDWIVFRFLAVFSFFPIFSAFLVSRFISISIFNYRYLIIAAVPYMILSALAVNRISDVRLRTLTLTIAVLWSAGVGSWNAFYYQNRINWLKLTDQIVKYNSQENSRQKIYTTEKWTSQPLENALDNYQSYKRNSVKEIPFGNISEKKFWFVYRINNWKETETPKQMFYRKNCSIKKQFSEKSFNEEVRAILIFCK